MKISIGTKSELKIWALNKSAGKFFENIEIVSVKTDSGVSTQPFGYAEIILGAKNRANSALEITEGDISCGIENGLIEIENQYYDIACVFLKTKQGKESISFSSGYFVPDWIIDEIKKNNYEFGFITQKLSGDSDKDPIKYFSNDKIKREEIISQAIDIAFIKIINKDKYKKL